MFAVKNYTDKGVIELRLSGIVRAAEIQEVFAACTQASATYHGKPHFMIADMRGLAPLSPELGAIMAEGIAHGREHGVTFCVHLSDSGIVRLQARRLAAEADPRSHGTMVDVVSLDEAWLQINTRLQKKAS